jgi:hypothetical protein
MTKGEPGIAADVQTMLQSGHHHPSWLIKKDRVEAGAAYFYSREGAVCIMGIPELGPYLRVTLSALPTDPPTIPTPPDHCEAAR